MTNLADQEALDVALRARCRTVLAASDQDIAIRLLQRDVLGEKASPEQQAAWAAEATRLGYRLGEEWANRHGKPTEAAQRLGVRVESRVGGLSQGRFVVSEYYTRNRRVIIYQDTLRLLGELIERLDLAGLFPPERLAEIALAHELYHWAETGELRATIRQTFRLPTITLGPIRITSRVMAANELVAHAFAQRVGRLPRSPVLLSLLLGSGAPVLIGARRGGDEFLHPKGKG